MSNWKCKCLSSQCYHVHAEILLQSANDINLESDDVGIGIQDALSKVKDCQRMASSIDKEFVDPASDK